VRARVCVRACACGGGKFLQNFSAHQYTVQEYFRGHLDMKNLHHVSCFCNSNK